MVDGQYPGEILLQKIITFKMIWFWRLCFSVVMSSDSSIQFTLHRLRWIRRNFICDNNSNNNDKGNFIEIISKAPPIKS